MGEVHELNVVADPDADGVAGLRHYLKGPLVLRMERRLDGVDLDVDPSEVGNRARSWQSCGWTEWETGLQLSEGVKKILAGVLG